MARSLTWLAPAAHAVSQKGEASWPFYEAPGGSEGSQCWVGADSCFLPSEYGVERSYLFSFEKGRRTPTIH